MKLALKYKPSKPCSCDICKSYCKRPGWWTVKEATQVVQSEFANRIMIEMSPEMNFGVLSPAFRGNECNFALQIFSENACTFFKNGLCELFNSKFQPLECRFCHHERKGLGLQCHLDIEKEWKTPKGQQLVKIWIDKMNLNVKFFH